MWTCPDCGRPFARAKHPQSCGRWTVEQFLEGRTEAERALFDAFRAACPGTLAPAKTRVGFQRRRIHAAANGWAKGALRVHVVLRREVEDPRFRIEPVDDVFVHHAVIRTAADAEALGPLLQEAWETYG